MPAIKELCAVHVISQCDFRLVQKIWSRNKLVNIIFIAVPRAPNNAIDSDECRSSAHTLKLQLQICGHKTPKLATGKHYILTT